MLTNLPGTTIDLTTVIPLVNSFTRSLSMAIFSKAALSMSLATLALARSLPFTWNTTSTVLSTAFEASPLGQATFVRLPSWPRMLHISSAICGANGWRSFAKKMQGESSGTACGPIAEPKNFLQCFAGFAVALVHLHEFVVENHELAYGRVEAHVLDVRSHLDDALVHHLDDCIRGGFVDEHGGCIFFAHHGTPGAVEAVSQKRLVLTRRVDESEAQAERSQSVHAFDALGLPRLHGIERAHEHFVQTKAVGAVVAHNVIRVHNVLQGLTHLGNDLVEFHAVGLAEELAQAPSASARPCQNASILSRHSP